MPEIEIEEDSRGRAEMVFKPLPGEDIQTFRYTARRISAAASFIKSHIKDKSTFGTGQNRKNAENLLASFLPQDVAMKLIQAQIDNKIGAKVIFKAKGEGDTKGFTVKKVEIPE